MDVKLLIADHEDWSDSANAQADLSLCWVHMSECMFTPTSFMVTQNSVDT